MIRLWKSRMCALSWAMGAYLCVMALISVINLTDPSEHRGFLMIPTESVKVRENLEKPVTVTHGSPRAHKLVWCKPLKWRHPPGHTVALVSFPGSGNTWMRYLLQQATGYLTGSVYKDYALLKNGFPGESVSNGTVLVVKTHEWGVKIRRNFSKAILILRDPTRSILAEFNRQSGGHIGHAPSTKYTRDKGKYWENFVRSKAFGWMKMTLNWLQFEGPLHLVLYDDLVNNLADEMRRIMEFLGIDAEKNDIDCMLKRKDGIYKRRKRKLPFDPFTANLRILIDRCRIVVDTAVKEYFKGNDISDIVDRINITFPLYKDSEEERSTR